MNYQCAVIFLLLLFFSSPAQCKTVTDATGREMDVPSSIDSVICSGPGCLRLLTYLQAESLVVAVDDMEGKRRKFDARPYAIANPQFKEKPIFGEFRGYDNPELILTLEPQPQVIFKTYPTMGHNPIELQKKTGIPVVSLHYGNLSGQREELYTSLRIMGEVLNRRERAAAVVSFIQSSIEDLEQRTSDIPPGKQPAVYLGGVAFKGPHGFQSTEPTYPPFSFVHVRNLAGEGQTPQQVLQHAIISKEQIISWNPDILFMDLSTLQLGEKISGLHELQNDPAYQMMDAVSRSEVYGVLPYNWYSKNFGSILANGYFIGHLLYPERFADVDPKQKADEIYTFLVGKAVFDLMNSSFRNLAFSRIEL